MRNPLQMEILITRGPEGSCVFPTSTDKKIPSSWSEIPPLPEKWFYHVLWFWIFGDPHFGTVKPSTISNPQLWWHYLNCTLWIHLNLFETILFIWLWFLLTLYPILCILGGKKHQFSVCPARFYVLHDRSIHSLMLFHQTVEGRVSSRCRSGVAGRALSQGNGISIMTSSWG